MNDTTILATVRNELVEAIYNKKDDIVRGAINKYLNRDDWTLEELRTHDISIVFNLAGDETYMIDGVILVVFFANPQTEIGGRDFKFEIKTTINYKVLI